MGRREITVQSMALKLASGEPVTLVDVRRYDERELGHIEGSIHIPLDELEDQMDELDPGGEYIVYCHHGIRSLSAVAMMEAAGIGRALSLRGGIEAWCIHAAPDIPRY